MKEDERTGAEGEGGRDTLGVGGRGTEALVLLWFVLQIYKYTMAHCYCINIQKHRRKCINIQYGREPVFN